MNGSPPTQPTGGSSPLVMSAEFHFSCLSVSRGPWLSLAKSPKIPAGSSAEVSKSAGKHPHLLGEPESHTVLGEREVNPIFLYPRKRNLCVLRSDQVKIDIIFIPHEKEDRGLS